VLPEAACWLNRTTLEKPPDEALPGMRDCHSQKIDQKRAARGILTPELPAMAA